VRSTALAAPGRRRAAGTLALVIAALSFGTAVFLHFMRFSMSGVSATVPQWRLRCGAEPSWLVSSGARSRCGEISLAYHATAALVLLTALLAIVAVTLLRRPRAAA